MSSQGGVLEERRAVPLVLEPTLSALAYIHSLGMIHRGECTCTRPSLNRFSQR